MSWISRISLVWLALFWLACQEDPTHGATCPLGQPSFHLTITAADGDLPADTHLRVTYSGSAVEDYDLANPSAGLSVLCTPQAAEEGVAATAESGAAPQGESTDEDSSAEEGGGLAEDGGGSADEGGSSIEEGGDAAIPIATAASLDCVLWTNGPADIELSASGYATLKRQLSAKRDECGIVMSDVDLSLDHPG